MARFFYPSLGALAAAGLAFLPFITSRRLLYGAVNAKFFYVTALAAVIILSGLLVWLKRKPLPVIGGRPLLWLSVLTLAVFYLAAFSGVNPEKSLWSDIIRSSGVFFLTQLFLLAVVLGEVFETADWVRLRRWAVLGGAFFVLLTYLGAEGLGFTGRLGWLNFAISGLTFGNSTFAGAYLLLILIFSLIELSRSEKKTSWRYVFFTTSSIILLSPTLLNAGLWLGRVPFGDVFSRPFLLLGTARASSAVAWAIIFYGLGDFLLNRLAPLNWRQRLIFGWSGLFATASVLGLILLFSPGSPVQRAYIKEASAARIIVWQAGWQAVKERPWLGWGPENFDRAWEKHFDHRLYLKENLGEIWFDRAHNLFIDTLVSVGAVGALMIMLCLGIFLRAVYRAYRAGLIGRIEASLLGAAVGAHILQLQTAFDTVATYTLVALFLAYGLWLERELAESRSAPSVGHSRTKRLNRVVALGLLVWLVFSLKTMLIDEFSRQSALFNTFTATESVKQLALIERSLSRVSDFESLRYSSSSFIRGILEEAANPSDQKQFVRKIQPYLTLYDKHDEAYLKIYPDYYRARMNYAYLLLIKTVFGDNRLNEAKTVIKDSYALSPTNPLTYVLDALTELYGGKVAAAKTIIKRGIALNPDIDLAKNVLAYIERQEKELPVITILKLSNL